MKKIFKTLLLIMLLAGCSSQGGQNMNEPVNTNEEEQTETSRAKVVVLAGQSNMEGNTWSTYLKNHFSDEQINRYIDGYEHSKIVWNNCWGNYKNINPYIKVQLGQGMDQVHFGPELGIADALDKAGNKETIYFIKFGWGGSNLYNQWRSPSSGTTGPIWPEFISFVKDSLAILDLKGLNPEICALCWMQGESDSDTTQIAGEYYSRLSTFVNDFRQEFDKYAAGPGIGFIDEIGRAHV